MIYTGSSLYPNISGLCYFKLRKHALFIVLVGSWNVYYTVLSIYWAVRTRPQLQVTNWWRLANRVHLCSRYTGNTTVTVAMPRRHDAAYSFIANTTRFIPVSYPSEVGGGSAT